MMNAEYGKSIRAASASERMILLPQIDTGIGSIRLSEKALYSHEGNDSTRLAPFAKLGQIDPSVAGFAVINPGLRARKSFAHFGVSTVLPLWIGLKQVSGSPEPAGGWAWITGEPLTYTNGAPGEPNNFSGPEDFGNMWPAGDPHGEGQWNDSQFFDFYFGIIEREVDPAVPTLSEWGLVVMTLLTLAAGTIILVRPRLARK